VLKLDNGKDEEMEEGGASPRKPALPIVALRFNRSLSELMEDTLDGTGTVDTVFAEQLSSILGDVAILFPPMTGPSDIQY
jgi:hypothetical protein